MKRTITTFTIIIIFLNFSILLEARCIRENLYMNNSELVAGSSNDTIEITRTIDASKSFREFPDLTGYRNTSVQKAPAPIVGKIAKESFGKAKITRCWLNLDEMWDYRTREFNFDFKIGVDKYKDIAEKHRETWDWQEESPSTFYQYMDAFSKNSDKVMLTIRRYERDILDKKLPISKEDWKMVFKKGLKHYKIRYPNIRYIEVGNEYSLKSFMNATDEEYYQFYKLGYEAVNEVNDELGFTGDNRILVGGPVVTGDVLKKINHFLELYTNDTEKEKQLDFVSWHDYNRKVAVTADREQVLKTLLAKYNLSKTLPLFMTEHAPFHFKKDKLESHYLNTAYLPKSLYFGSLTGSEVKIFPWVLYHRKEIQTQFMWFSGPNEADTKEEEIKMLPLGCAMKFLSMLKGKEIKIDNSIDGNDLVLAAFEKDRLVVETINYSGQRDVTLNVKKLKSAFPGLMNGKLHVVKYLIDSNHSNCLAKPEYQGGIEKLEDSWVKIRKGKIILSHNGLEKNGLVLWELTK